MIHQFNLIKNILKTNFRSLPLPYKVTFALTYKCNLKCRICNIWKKPYFKEMSTAEIAEVFSNIKNLNWLDLTGGEITQRHDLGEILRAIITHSTNLSILHLSTNGQSPEGIIKAIQIVPKRIVTIVTVSIDGPSEIHDQLRGKEGAYKKAIQTYNNLKSLFLAERLQTYISCTISHYNLNHIDRLLIDLFREIDNFSSDEVHFNISHRSNHYYKNLSMKDLGKSSFFQFRKFLELSEKGNIVKKLLERRYLNFVEGFFTQGLRLATCQSLRATCFIDPYGNVFPCTIYDRPLGNLKKCNFEISRLWSGDTASEIRKAIAQKKCPGCCTPCEVYPALLGSLLKLRDNR